jgi:hypothetical protein
MGRHSDPRIGSWFQTPNGPAIVRASVPGKLTVEYLNGEIDDAFQSSAKLAIIESVDEIIAIARENPSRVGKSFKWMLLT